MHVNSLARMKARTTTPGLKVADKLHGTDRPDLSRQLTEGWPSEFHRKDIRCILHLFSGPAHRDDGFAAAVAALGYHCVEYDVVNGEDQDLTNDAIWQRVLADIKAGKYDGMLAGPPCNSFTNARKHDGEGPGPLRGAHGDERYGLQGLSEEDKQKVRVGTLLALRTSEAATELLCQEKPSIIEQPRWKQDGNSVSMFNLDEFQELLQRPHVRHADLVQCEYGARTTKPTTLMLAMIGTDELRNECTHQQRSWRKPSTGERHWGAHPPLRGKEWYIPAEDWNENMMMTPFQIKQHFRDIPYLTSSAQAYPADLNRMLAELLTRNLPRLGKVPDQPTEFVVMGKWRNVLKRKAVDGVTSTVRAKVEFTAPLKGKRRRVIDRDALDEQYWGGMRRPRTVLERLPGYRQAGIRVHQTLQTVLDSCPALESACLDAIGSTSADAGPSQAHLDVVRDALSKEFSEIDTSHCTPAMDSQLRADLIWQISRAMGDPDADCIYGWLVDGAPAGISLPIEDPGNIFPPDVEGAADMVPHLLPDHANHHNYTSVDADDAAGPEIQRLIDTGFVKAFGSHGDLTAWVGGQPHLSKLGMITKEKDGKVKRRLILDCKESGVNRLAASGGRLLLPRISDAIDDALYLMSQSEGDKQERVEWLILDSSDWFYNVPLHPSERRHFAWAYQSTWVAFKTQAQGSKNAPLVCGRVAALISRMTQATFGDQVYRLQLYVDDPCICMLGNDKSRNRMMAATILFWACCGIRLAYKKASRGFHVTWIGAEMQLHHQGLTNAQITVRAKPEIVEEVKKVTQTHVASNLATRKSLLSYIGKLNHIAGIVEVIRPFMSDLYGVIHCTTGSRAPANCYWTKQWNHVTQWLLAFFAEEPGSVCRVYRVQAYFGRGLAVSIITDASPWGLGGYLMVNNTVIAYFSSAITQQDESILGLKIGDAAGQQVLEALAVLVALRLWQKYWRKPGVSLRIRSDNVSTLTLLVKLRPKYTSHGMSIVARELALEFGTSSYKPLFFQHIPGFSNDWADLLSRLHQPDKQVELPEMLLKTKQVDPMPRNQSYYRALTAASQGSR
eukprot:s3225_g7.t1